MLFRSDFQIYAVRTVDEAMGLLTGLEPGQRRDDGSYPGDSINGRVAEKLEEFAKHARRYRGADDE